jgi:hypothetical protein
VSCIPAPSKKLWIFAASEDVGTSVSRVKLVIGVGVVESQILTFVVGLISTYMFLTVHLPSFTTASYHSATYALGSELNIHQFIEISVSVQSIGKNLIADATQFNSHHEIFVSNVHTSG